MKNLFSIIMLTLPTLLFGQSHVTQYEVADELEWQVDKFIPKEGASTGETRIITLAQDTTSVTLQFIVGKDTVTYSTQVVKNVNTTITNGKPIQALFLQDEEGYPYLLEIEKEKTALYFKYDLEKGGYNGFHGSELLTIKK